MAHLSDEMVTKYAVDQVQQVRAIVEMIDRLITFWRTQLAEPPKNLSTKEVECYIDAYQTVRRNITGQRLG